MAVCDIRDTSHVKEILPYNQRKHHHFGFAAFMAFFIHSWQV
jgi:hypothetical protein